MQIPKFSKVSQALAAVLLGTASLVAAQNDMPLKTDSERIIVAEPDCFNAAVEAPGLFYFEDCVEAVRRVFRDPDHSIRGSKDGCIRLTDYGRCTTQLCYVNDGAVEQPWKYLAPYLQVILPTCQVDTNKGLVTGGSMLIEGTHPYGQHHFRGVLYVGTEEGKPTADGHPHDELRLASREVAAAAATQEQPQRRQRDESRAVLAQANSRLELRTDPPLAEDLGDGYRLRVTFASNTRAAATRAHVFDLMSSWQANARGYLERTNPEVVRWTESIEPPNTATNLGRGLHISLTTSNAERTPLYAAMPQRLLPGIRDAYVRLWANSGPDRNRPSVLDRNRGPDQFDVVLEYQDPNSGAWRDLASLLFMEMHLQNVNAVNENLERLGIRGGGTLFYAKMEVNPFGL